MFQLCICVGTVVLPTHLLQPCNVLTFSSCENISKLVGVAIALRALPGSD